LSIRDVILPRDPDVLGILCEHAAVVADGLGAFARWAAAGDDGDAQAVRDLEHQADEHRRRLGDVLHDVLVTPIDRETLFVLGERLDAALNRAKNLVRQAQVAGWAPDADVAVMAARLAAAARHVRGGIDALGRDHEVARAEAANAVKCVRGVEHRYRDAVAAASGAADTRDFVVRLELYRYCLTVGDALEETARRLAYEGPVATPRRPTSRRTAPSRRSCRPRRR
jgi:uncharacterized protein Yka (UPF0111/DUF47 family)